MLIYILLLSIQVPANIVCLIIASYSVASGGRGGRLSFAGRPLLGRGGRFRHPLHRPILPRFRKAGF